MNFGRTAAAVVAAMLTVFVFAQSVSANGHSRVPVVEISADYGGSVVEYAQRIFRVRQQNTQVVFSGECASACTLYLSLPSSQTCIGPRASFAFHRAYNAPEDVNQWGTDFLMARYPGWVQRWISSQGGLSDRVIWMDYAYASQFLRPCGQSDLSRLG